MGPATSESAVEINDGYVLVLIDKSGVTSAFDVQDAFRVQKTQGKVTLFKAHAKRSLRSVTTKPVQEEQTVLVPRTPQPITTVRGR